MSKINKFFLVFISISFIIFYHPVISFAMNDSELEVIIGYDNNIGKEMIIDKSNEVDYVFSSLSAISVSIDQSDLDDLQQNPNITHIENNAPVSLTNGGNGIKAMSANFNVTEGEQWNIESINSSSAWGEGYNGTDVNIAVIDTGISTHSDLKVSGGYSSVGYTSEWTDDNGHGTHVAGVIGSELNNFGVVGVAPEADIFAVKALDQNGEGNLFSLLEAIDWAIKNNMDIINLSLGNVDNSSYLKEAIDKAYEKYGILIVGASGNGGENSSVIYPAKYENVIGVSAVNEKLNIAKFSSRGQAVEFSAPGVNIISTYLNDSYGIADGTSQATPHVSGMLALLKQKFPGMPPVELRRTLVNHVKDLGSSGRDTVYGYGFVKYSSDQNKKYHRNSNGNLTYAEEYADGKLVKIQEFYPNSNIENANENIKYEFNLNNNEYIINAEKLDDKTQEVTNHYEYYPNTEYGKHGNKIKYRFDLNTAGYVIKASKREKGTQRTLNRYEYYPRTVYGNHGDAIKYRFDLSNTGKVIKASKREKGTQRTLNWYEYYPNTVYGNHGDAIKYRFDLNSAGKLLKASKREKGTQRTLNWYEYYPNTLYGNHGDAIRYRFDLNSAGKLLKASKREKGTQRYLNWYEYYPETVYGNHGDDIKYRFDLNSSGYIDGATKREQGTQQILKWYDYYSNTAYGNHGARIRSVTYK
ncbi:S8 family peptidase [Virgibacillus litoralis]|uniref:Ribosomal protein L25 (General stress protein Ctc) n=1 Tax=Virgibacillus litoralis TaxID=578221 RepID=A0ABS4HI87_9BACI|nr:S8 family peptidase [Virgibacillus litoralis]MBP1950548.1 ribosomal protein L25 (general stress protein Ctc) [Virgibacillus litoralis]